MVKAKTGAAETAAEDAVEMGEVAIAAGEGDAGDRVGAVAEQVRGVVEAEAGEGVEEGGAGVGAEKFVIKSSLWSKRVIYIAEKIDCKQSATIVRAKRNFAARIR